MKGERPCAGLHAGKGERSCAGLHAAQPECPYAGLHVLADDDPRWPSSPLEQALAACAGGASVVQLRAKHATDAQVVEWGREIRALTARAGLRFVLNDRFDLALLCGADAVHLGQQDLPPGALPAEAVRRLGIGRSSHDEEQAEAAISGHPPLSYLAFGPLFGTTSKQSPYAARGLAALAEIAGRAGVLPVVAIGGISLDNVADVARAGASGVAVISAVAAADDPARVVRELATAFADAREACG